MGIGEPTLPPLEALDAENEMTEYVPSTVIISLDVLLRELKRKLLKDEASTLVLTGPRGCGKTTLAKKICQDKEVKDIFKKSIFFVRVSKRPNLSVIVRKLYQQIEHKGSQILELQEDTIALKWLQIFLKETGQHPSLLVLDDVWPGSEPILDKFDNFKTSDYKILVTSRSEFPTFGSPYYLQSINDEGTMTLSHHSRANSFESLDDEDLVRVSPATSFRAMDDDPTACFCDFSTSYLEDRISHVSEDANLMTHFHDSSASTAGDTSSSVSKDVGTKLPLGNPVKSTQTYKQQKLGLKKEVKKTNRVDDLEQNSLPSSLGGAEDKNDPEAKRWKAENVSDQTSSDYGGRIVKEPMFGMHTISAANIMDDGYSWRKYGQKEQTGYPNLRSYYRCTFQGCPMKKRVDQTSHDSKVVTTTYNGTTHDHGSSSNNMYMPVLELPFQNIEQPTTETQSPYIKGSERFPGL
ncbi:unnamed protein product [Prunus armeniaca]|uniref:WRKY domain-containing protein n=1 Tax=Prunus armeniaca TaxID=36596 RepID=A0A6J5XFJ9_PRUAR|nr:unnamed protein product [Prunus armeniaca]